MYVIAGIHNIIVIVCLRFRDIPTERIIDSEGKIKSVVKKRIPDVAADKRD